MTKDEILKIKEHIEIHARRELRAIKITEILWKAVDELEHISELEQENAELKAQNEKMKCCGNCKHYKPVVTVNESISNMCEDYYNGCNNNIYEPYNKQELKKK